MTTNTLHMIGRADRLLRAQLEEALAPAGVTVAGLMALSMLQTHAGLSNARLARRMLVTPQAMHKVLRALELDGLVERSPSARGGRALATRLTEEGVALLGRIGPLVQRVEEAFLAPLQPVERVALDSILHALTRIHVEVKNGVVEPGEGNDTA